MKKIMHLIYKNDFFHHDYDRYYFGLRYLGNLTLLKMLETLNIQDKRILDVGSGRLILSTLISCKGSRLVALDFPDIFIDREVKERAKYYEIDLVGYQIRPGKPPYLPFCDHCFSAVLLTEVIEHLNFSPLSLLKEISRVLENEGYLIITTPNVHRLENKINYLFFNKNIYSDLNRYMNAPPQICHWREFDKREIKKILKACSFEVIKSYYCNDILINKYSYYLYNGIIGSARGYIKKWLYFITFFLPALKKQIVVIARKNNSL